MSYLRCLCLFVGGLMSYLRCLSLFVGGLMSYLRLFGNFYYHSYIQSQQEKKKLY
jgi:hypothetical protein